MGLPLIGSTGTGNKNFAPIYEHEYMVLSSDTVKAGAKTDPSVLTAYASTSTGSADKSYVKITYANLKENAGKDVTLSVKLYKDVEMSGYYVDGITRDQYICYRTDDRANFIYVKKGSESLDTIQGAIKDGMPVILSGTLYDIQNNIKSANKYGIVVDSVEVDE